MFLNIYYLIRVHNQIVRITYLLRLYVHKVCMENQMYYIFCILWKCHSFVAIRIYIICEVFSVWSWSIQIYTTRTFSYALLLHPDPTKLLNVHYSNRIVVHFHQMNTINVYYICSLVTYFGKMFVDLCVCYECENS